RHKSAELRRALAGAVVRAGGLCRGDLLGRHHIDAQGPVGGGALHGPDVLQDAGLCGAAAGHSPGCAAAHQPHHRHHQEHRARHRHRRRRDPEPGHHRPVLHRQCHAADDGRHRLHRAVRPRRCARPLDRDALCLAESLMEMVLEQFLNLAIMQKVWPLLLRGLGTTAYLCALVIPLGLAGGLMVALLSLSRSRTVVWATIALVDLFRAAPPLVLLILLYSGLPFADINLSPTVAVCLAFFCNTSSYYGEIYRAGIESVGRGQWEAARST